MREANKMNAKSVLFIGGDEYKEGMINLKNMSTSEEEKIPLTEIQNLIVKIKSQQNTDDTDWTDFNDFSSLF